MSTAEAARDVWLYVNDPHSVRLHVQPGPAGFQLVIRGPNNATAEFDFTEMVNLDRFRSRYERDLVARGFQLQGAAERRQAGERRLAPRPISWSRRREAR